MTLAHHAERERPTLRTDRQGEGGRPRTGRQSAQETGLRNPWSHENVLRSGDQLVTDGFRYLLPQGKNTLKFQ